MREAPLERPKLSVVVRRRRWTHAADEVTFLTEQDMKKGSSGQDRSKDVRLKRDRAASNDLPPATTMANRQNFSHGVER